MSDQLLQQIAKAQNPNVALESAIGSYKPNPITFMDASRKYGPMSMPSAEEAVPYTNARSFGGR
jgi:hypothetical protein